MILPTSFSEKLIYSTVRLKTSYPDGKEGFGTAFFFLYRFQHENQERDLPLIITNRHVVEGAYKGWFICHVGKRNDQDTLIPSGENFWFDIGNFSNAWFYPSDNEIDLAAMPFQPLINDAEQKNKTLYRVNLDKQIIYSDEELRKLSAVEDVLMAGYPTGLWDEANNAPIIRRGITASHPSFNYNGKSWGVVDIGCFPGSSGSPILIINEGQFSTKEGDLIVGSRVIFLGVLFGGPIFTQEGEIEIAEIPTAQIPISKTNLMIHLGYYIKAKEIIRLIEEVILPQITQ